MTYFMFDYFVSFVAAINCSRLSKENKISVVDLLL